MPSTALFDFRDASIYGDPKWTRGSPRFGRFAPAVVLTLAVLSIIEVIIGVVWITSVQSLGNGWGDLTFPQVIQPLIVPALAFFNTIPSLHLHVLARSNNPRLAMVFSGLLAAVFLGSAVVFLPPCTGGSAPDANANANVQISTYQRTECPGGGNKGVWATMVALQFISFVGYMVHFLMAAAVWKGLREYDEGGRSWSWWMRRRRGGGRRRRGRGGGRCKGICERWGILGSRSGA